MRLRSSRRRNAIAKPTGVDGILDESTLFALDRRLLSRFAGASDTELAAGQVVRASLRPGKSSHFVSLVDIRHGTAETRLVEKCVDVTRSEVTFWRNGQGPTAVLSTELFDAVRPIDIVECGTAAMLYFPYHQVLDRETKILRRDFRNHIHEITAAVADFNGRNHVQSTIADVGLEPFPLVPPAPQDLRRRLGLLPSAVDAIHELWARASSRWNAIRYSYERLPQCLNHNDISPGNAVRSNGLTLFSDFGLSSTGPVGSDLHTIIRWSERAAHDPEHVDALITTYVAQIRRHVPSITWEQVHLAAWATYFLRYTNLKFASSRHMHAFGLALNEMLKLRSLAA